MNYLIRFFDEKYARYLLASITLAAFLIRLLILIYWMDAPGDGPSKATYAYNWYTSPFTRIETAWLPGFTYVTGAFTFIISNPLWSIRILNLVIGTLTVPIFYVLVRKVYDHVSASFSACILAFLPVHVALSASSLTEPTFLFEIVAGIILLIKAAETQPPRIPYLILSLFFISLALMSRYESWFFIPFFVAYYYWKSKHLPTSIVVITVLVFFPLLWIIDCYLQGGNALMGFAAAKDEPLARSVSLLPAIKGVGKESVQQLEWTLVILSTWGLIIQAIRSIKKKLTAEQVLLLSMTLCYWAVMVCFAMTRGPSFQVRYLLFGLVMALPFAIVPLFRYIKDNRNLIFGCVVFVLFAFAIPKIVVLYPLNDLTRKKPDEIKNVASWLKGTTYSHDPILMTSNRGQSTYLPLYLPQIGVYGHGHFIFAPYGDWVAPWLERFVINRKPSLLITCDRDYDLQKRIEAIWGKGNITDSLVHKEGFIKIYDIKNLSRDKARMESP